MKTRVWWTALIAVAVATTSCTSGGDRVTFPTAAAPLLTNTSLPASTASPRSAPATTAPAPIAPATKTIATGVPLPWGLAFIHDGTAQVEQGDQGGAIGEEGQSPGQGQPGRDGLRRRRDGCGRGGRRSRAGAGRGGRK